MGRKKKILEYSTIDREELLYSIRGDIPSVDNADLIQELNQLGGYSQDEKFVPLIDICLAYAFETDHGTYVVSRSHENGEIISYNCRLPFISEIIEDQNSQKFIFHSWKKLYSKWFFLKPLEKTTNEEQFSFIQKLMGQFHILKVPKFLIEELEEYLKNTEDPRSKKAEEFDYEKLTIEIKSTKCIACGTEIELLKNEKITTCPRCKISFSVV